jgi:lipoate-protein ligase B
MQTCCVYRLGTIEYQKTRNLQNQLAAQIAAGGHPPTLLLLEHSHVYTFGRNGQPENLFWDEQERKRRNVDVHWLDRGRDAAYHGPGQLVGYALLKLPKGGSQLEAESGKLEKTIVETLAGFGVVSGQMRGQTGVWIQPDVISRCVHCPPDLKQAPAKIASIEVNVDANGISRHGFALDVNPDMSYWEGILARGQEKQNRASLEYFLDPLPAIDVFAETLTEVFGTVFDYQMERIGQGAILL